MSDIRADQEILSPFCRGAIHELQCLEQSGRQNMKCGHQRGFTVYSQPTAQAPLKAFPSGWPPGPQLLYGSTPKGSEGDEERKGRATALSQSSRSPCVAPEARVRSRPAPCLQPLIGTPWATQALLSSPRVPCCCRDHCLEPAALPHPLIPTPPCPLHGTPPILRTGPITSDYY